MSKMYLQLSVILTLIYTSTKTSAFCIRNVTFPEEIKCNDCLLSRPSITEEIICEDLTSTEQLKQELNNQFNPDIFYSPRGSSYKLIINNSTLNTITPELFNNTQVNQIQEISITNSGIKKIDKKSFSRFHKLQFLNISNNEIEEVETEEFPRMEELNMENNKIKKISNKHIKKIILSHNNFPIIDEHLFAVGSIFDELLLQHSNIKTIKENSFVGIVFNKLNISSNSLTNLNFTIKSAISIDASHNNLTLLKLKIFQSNFMFLKKLDLSYNLISKISNNVSDNIIPRLNTLKLNNNNITVIRKNYFKMFKNLYYLNLSNNPLITIDANSFNSEHLYFVDLRNTIRRIEAGIYETNLCNTKYFDLSRMRIDSIASYSFEKCQRIEEFHLGGNNLTTLRKNVFYGLNNMKLLNLTGNLISEIEVGAFNVSSSNNLLNLYLSGLREIRADFFMGLTKLSQLHLRNISLDSVPSSVFRFMPYLDELYLINSEIKLFHDYSFRGVNLRYLNLTQNSVKSKINFTYLTKLKTLVISATENISDLKGLNNLATLFYDNNNINEIELNFCETPNLLHLHLNNNQIKNINNNNFECLTNLMYLTLEKNEIKFIETRSFNQFHNLTTLDLKNNKLDKLHVGLFQNLSNLQQLHLEQNNIREIDVGTLSPLFSLEYLNISQNLLESFDETVFNNMAHLKYLDLSSNRLVFVAPVIENLLQMPNLLYFGLVNNIWQCEVLMHQIKFMNFKNLAYKSIANENDFQYETYNIDGIACLLEM